MRIVLWAEAFWPKIGGVEVNAAELVPLLSQRGHEISVITARDDSDLPPFDLYRGVAVHRLPLLDPLRRRDLGKIADTRRRLGELWRELSPQLVHVMFCFGPSVFFLNGVARAGSGPTVVTVPGYVEAPTGGHTLMRNTLTRAAWVTAPSHAVHRHITTLFPEVGGRSSVIYNGLAEPEGTRDPLPSPDGPPTLVCIGRLTAEKGFDVAVSAMGQVIEQHPTARLLIAGDGPERGGLERLASDCGVAESTDFLGWVSPRRVWELLDRAHVVIVPSRAVEGFGLVAVEAALRERPVVASRIGGLPEVVADGETGVLCEPDDSGALAEAVVTLLSTPARAAALGRAGAARARERFALERQADGFEALFAELVGGACPTGVEARARSGPRAKHA
ncbi:MAG: glycosyltransferase family 4 protein [Solirubrobacteraceae bacterium]